MWYKTEVLTISEFMDGKHKRKDKAKQAKREKRIGNAIAPLASVPVMLATLPAYATEPSLQAKVASAFTPLVDLAQGVSYPLALIMIIGGCLFIMVGNKDKGFSMIQAAGIGYILCQIAPLIMGLLVEITEAL